MRPAASQNDAPPRQFLGPGRQLQVSPMLWAFAPETSRITAPGFLRSVIIPHEIEMPVATPASRTSTRRFRNYCALPPSAIRNSNVVVSPLQRICCVSAIDAGAGGLATAPPMAMSRDDDLLGRDAVFDAFMTKRTRSSVSTQQ